MIQIAVDMGVPVINTEFSGDPNQQEIRNGMFFRSMEELLPIIEREGLRVEIQSHPYDFCELNDEACDIVKSFRSPNLGYVYSASHGFFYDQGKGDVRHMLEYAGDELTHVLFADTWNQTKDCRYILNPPWLNAHGRANVTIHQHTAMGEGEVDFDGIFETLREMDFANKQLKPNAPKVGGDMTVYENIFVGREIHKNGIVDKKAEIKEAKRLIEECGLHVSPTETLRHLTVAQCQLIEIIKAISVNAKVIIMDEPTAAITDREVELLFGHIRRLQEKGVAIIYISHRMDEIFAICDSITVYRDGQYIGSGKTSELNEAALIKMMVGREITDVFPKLDLSFPCLWR